MLETLEMKGFFVCLFVLPFLWICQLNPVCVSNVYIQKCFFFFKIIFQHSLKSPGCQPDLWTPGWNRFSFHICVRSATQKRLLWHWDRTASITPFNKKKQHFKTQFLKLYLNHCEYPAVSCSFLASFDLWIQLPSFFNGDRTLMFWSTWLLLISTTHTLLSVLHTKKYFFLPCLILSNTHLLTCCWCFLRCSTWGNIWWKTFCTFYLSYSTLIHNSPPFATCKAVFLYTKNSSTMIKWYWSIYSLLLTHVDSYYLNKIIWAYQKTFHNKTCAKIESACKHY